MKTKNILLALVICLSVGSITFGDRQMDTAEVLQIFQQLTNQPKRTWIPAGVMQARHEEYRAPKTTDIDEVNSKINQRISEYQNNQAKQELTEELQKMKLDAIPFNVRHELSNEYTMNSTVTVRFDGDRFYWQIDVDSRTDSVKPDKDLAGNFMTDEFNLDWNTKRIFAWDSEKYTTYFLPGNHAIVDSTGATPHVVNGPLTAGFIPWGYGYYSYDNLAAADSQAVERNVDGQIQVHLTLNNADGTQMVFVMDPTKNYAVISSAITGYGDAVISKQYSNYMSVSGNWVPMIILLERYEVGSNRFLARNLWEITAIDATMPGIDSFNIAYEPDALIEYVSFITDKPAIYRYSQTVDTDKLLAERLSFAANEGLQRQNCATVALKYAVTQLGKEVTDTQLAGLVNESNNETSLSAMKQFATSLGLYCRAVTTNIDTLRDLQNCQVILHIPGKKHFAVLESIDDGYVRIIDLANDKFYYRTNIDFFGMDWTQGTALLLSSNSLQGQFTEIADSELGDIVGASDYHCAKLLQEYDVIYCTEVGGLCGGIYVVYYTRYGCEAAESGSCGMSWFLRCKTSLCIEDPYYPLACTVTGEWTCYYMRACA